MLTCDKNQEIKNKINGNFGYIGKSNPRCDLNKMLHAGDTACGRNHVCNIW